MTLAQTVLKTIAYVSGAAVAQAHCDIPCGIYDPHQAQVAALTIIRMIGLAQENEHSHTAHHDIEFRNSMMRAIMIKEEHGRILKQEIATIWGDYFKAEHLKKYPDLSGLVHKIMQLTSKAKQTMDRQQAEELLNQVNRFAEIFWETKDIATKRVKSPYKPEMEVVYPVV